MGQVVYLGLCLLACLLLSPSVEGTDNATEVDARARCPSGAFYYKQYCYQLVNNPVSWEEAEIQCQEIRNGLEAHLASIQTRNEERIIVYSLKKKYISTCWIGLQGTNYNGHTVYEWSDGFPFREPLWDGRKPSTSSNECFALSNILNTNPQRWSQRACSDTLPYLCKFKADY